MSFQLTVNELSKISGVSPRNIRYYYSIGLFKCSGTLENGYRYYTVEKIEELRLISYLRHMGVPIQEIKRHLSNRNIDEYSAILENQLLKVEKEIEHLTALKERIIKRIESIGYIRSIPALDEIIIEKLPSRPILKLMLPTKEPMDWEKALLKFEQSGDIPPSLIIGDAGFFVDLEKLDSRKPTEFKGIYMFADDPFLEKSDMASSLPSGHWLTLYIRGDHYDASKRYADILKYANGCGLTLGDYALERTLIDHFISSDPDLYITEIQIPIADM